MKEKEISPTKHLYLYLVMSNLHAHFISEWLSNSPAHLASGWDSIQLMDISGQLCCIQSEQCKLSFSACSCAHMGTELRNENTEWL